MNTFCKTSRRRRRDEIWYNGGRGGWGAGLIFSEEISPPAGGLFADAELLEYLVDGFRTGTAAGEGEQGIGGLLQADRNGIEGLTGGEGFDALPQTAAGGGDALQLPGIGDNGRSGIEVGKADHLPDGFGELREAVPAAALMETETGATAAMAAFSSAVRAGGRSCLL